MPGHRRVVQNAFDALAHLGGRLGLFCPDQAQGFENVVERDVRNGHGTECWDGMSFKRRPPLLAMKLAAELDRLFLIVKFHCLGKGKKSSARCLSLGDGVYAIPQLLPGLARVFSGLGQWNVWKGSETGLASPFVVSVAKHPGARTGAGDLESEPCDTAHGVHTGSLEPLDF